MAKRAKGFLNNTNMPDYSSDLHKAYVKISSWYQDSSIFYSMTEDESLDAYDFMYSTLRRFVDGPLPGETLTEEAIAERAAIEEMAPEVIAHLNSFISQAVFMPSIEEEEDQSNIMKLFDKQTIKESSFVMAGGACLIGLIGHYLRIDGPLHVRGIQFLTSLVVPTLCFWVGMLIRYKVGKPKWWVLAIAGVAMLASLFFSRHTVNILHWMEIRLFWYFIALAGFLMPWNYLYERRDKDGYISAVLLVITVFTYAAIELCWQRMGTSIMLPKHEDIATLLLVVTTNILPIAAIPPVFFAAMFSFSNAGQWLGEKKWFRWTVGIAAIASFIGILPGLRFDLTLDPLYLTRWIQLSVQPVTIYLIIVICRIISKFGKKKKTWKEVFNL